MKYVISFKNKCGDNCMTGADTRKDTFHQIQYLKGYGYTILKVEEIRPKLGGKAAWDVT